MSPREVHGSVIWRDIGWANCLPGGSDLMESTHASSSPLPYWGQKTRMAKIFHILHPSIDILPKRRDPQKTFEIFEGLRYSLPILRIVEWPSVLHGMRVHSASCTPIQSCRHYIERMPLATSVETLGVEGFTPSNFDRASPCPDLWTAFCLHVQHVWDVAQNDPNVALIILTTHMWGKIFS